MVISSRSFGLMFATAMVAALAIRTESASTQDWGSIQTNPDQLASEAETPSGAGRATLNMVSQTPPKTYDLGVRGVPTPSNPAGPVISRQTETSSSQVDESANVESTDSESATSQYRPPTDDTASWTQDQPVSDSTGFTDRELFDRYIGFLSDDERAQFQMVWAGMSPAERQAFLNSMH